MSILIYTILVFLLCFVITFLCKKFKLLLSFTGDKHQKFVSKFKIPLTGGIILFFSICFFEINLYVKILSLLFFLLGLISDLKILSSANIRFIVQVFLILFSVVLLDLEIQNTRILILDHLLNNRFFNIFFVTFCIIIIINGTNFIDGVNLNVNIYFLLITLILIYLSYQFKTPINQISLIYLSISLVVICIFNFNNFLFLGDNGSYLLGFFFSINLIEFYILNQQISPFFIILLLWYPSFEILFSIIRKNIYGKSPLKPDNLHIHHLIFTYLKKKQIKKFYNNNITGITINIFNILIILLALKDINNSQNMIILILLCIMVYLVTYLKLYNKKIKKIEYK